MAPRDLRLPHPRPRCRSGSVRANSGGSSKRKAALRLVVSGRPPSPRQVVELRLGTYAVAWLTSISTARHLTAYSSGVSLIEIGGLPAHILLVHGVVVFAPLAGLMAVLFALWPRSRTYLAWPLGSLALLLVPLSVITAEAGEQLEDARPASKLIEEHAEQGSFFRIVTVIFLFVVATQVLAAFPTILSRWPALRGAGQAFSARWLIPATSVLGILGGMFLIYESVLAGHSGSASVWSGT